MNENILLMRAYNFFMHSSNVPKEIKEAFYNDYFNSHSGKEVILRHINKYLYPRL